jgi:hypothetical protein
MNEETKTQTDVAELDRLEYEIFKKYWQPMMKELIELQELRDAVPIDDVSVVRRMSDELNTLKQGFEDIKGMLTNALKPQATGTPQPPQYPAYSTVGTYAPGVPHMPLYRPGQAFVVAPMQQPNQ